MNGNDVLLPAQPYAKQVLTSFLAVGKSTSTHPTTTGGTSVASGTTTTTVPSAPTGTSAPQNQVVFDSNGTLPEPWNPTPC